MYPSTNLRWMIVGLLALATALNYLDRQTLPVVISEVQKEIPVSNAEYSQLQFYFLLAYGIMYAGGGRLVDLLGSRAGYLLVIGWWSAATILHGFANSVAMLGAARFLLGLGEGGGFPASAKVVSEWFTARDRSFAFGIFNTGSSVGAVVAPPLIAAIVTASDWRWVFYITGGAGFLWALAWWWLYQDAPKNHAANEQSELQSRRSPATPWLQLFRIRQVRGLLLAKFLSDSAWFFFIFWLPKYLADVRGLNISEIGYYAWIPYAFAGMGSYVGGWLGSFLIRRNRSVDASRKLTLGLAACLMPFALGIGYVPLSGAIVLFSLVMLGHQFWSTILQTVPADMFPSTTVGSVAGLMGAAGSFGGMLFNLAVGEILTRYESYLSVFAVSGLLHLVSFGVIVLVVGKIQLLTQQELGARA